MMNAMLVLLVITLNPYIPWNRFRDDGLIRFEMPRIFSEGFVANGDPSLVTES
jgi:hypothetical protein